MIDFTTVVGVDDKHLKQLQMVYPTWIKHKPCLLEYPMVVFFDSESSVTEQYIRDTIQHPCLTVFEWPFVNVSYEGNENSKFNHPQRYKMLAGFVHVPAQVVNTKYWLKLDTDVVAVGKPDWIKDWWFDGGPTIIAHPWSYTKPPDQMLRLDQWVEQNKATLNPYLLPTKEPLNMVPNPGASLYHHTRIISWCGFFNTNFTKEAAQDASNACGLLKLPVPSQDGYLWYYAQRMGYSIRRVNMKELAWEHWGTEFNVRSAVERSLCL